MIARNKQQRAAHFEAAMQRLDDCRASSISLLALNPTPATTQEVFQ